jgi:hypothetical protein
MTEPRGETWISLDEAARRLGVSRLRLREAIAAGALTARRDNHGFWRVSFGDEASAMRRIATARAQPHELVELLFDEIEEMTTRLSERDEDVAGLMRVVERQQALLDRALRRAEEENSADMLASAERLAALQERSHTLIGRAKSELEARDVEVAKVTGLLDRAMDAAGALDAEVARQTDVARRQRALIDRLFALAQTSLERIAPVSRGGWLARWRAFREGGK